MTWRQVVYMILDELKLSSDDAQINEEHIMFLIDTYRAFILKQRYSDIKRNIPEINYQTICIDLEEVPAVSGKQCEGESYLRSTTRLPEIIPIGKLRVYPMDYFQGEITYVSKDRLKYTGYNKYLKNIIYCAIDPDNYLYFKSLNPQFRYLEKVKVSGIFQNSEELINMQCTDVDNICDPMDMVLPLEDALVPTVIEMITKKLSSAIYGPDDETNNAKDDLVNTPVK